MKEVKRKEKKEKENNWEEQNHIVVTCHMYVFPWF